MKESAKTGSAPYKLLDAWRGLASLWVVLYHACGAMLEGRSLPGGGAVMAIGGLGYLGVQMFFVISGYCISLAGCSVLRRRGRCREFIFARVRRIYPPCWVSLVFYAAFAVAAGFLAERGRISHSAMAQTNLLHQSPLYFVGNLTLTQIPLRVGFLSVVCWTLCYEVAFYLIVAAALFVALRGGRDARFMLSLLHGVTLISLIFLIAAPHRAAYPFDLWPHFGLGVMVFDILRHPEQNAPKWWFGAATAGMLAFILLYRFPMGLMTYGYKDSRGMFLGAVVFACICLPLYRYDETLSRNAVVKILATIGIFSYSLYLTHFYFIGIFNQAFKMLHVNGVALYGALVLTITAAVITGRIFHQFFERPFMKSPLRSPRTEALTAPVEPEKVS